MTTEIELDSAAINAKKKGQKKGRKPEKQSGEFRVTKNTAKGGYITIMHD